MVDVQKFQQKGLSTKKLAVSAAFALIVGAASVDFNQAGATSDQVIKLNNEGVNALKANNFSLAVSKFDAALKLDPTYKLARENLAIAYNNYGISQQNNPLAALGNFHKSLFYSPENPTAVQNLEVTIQNLGKDPKNFKDRVALGKQARQSGDFEGAAVEYAAALMLKDDPKLRIDLGDVYRVRDQVDRAIDQYKVAAKSPALDPDSQVRAWTSLGQCYQAKQDYPNSVASYNQAILINRSDRETLEANRAVWDEAVRKDPTSSDNHVGLGQAYAYLGDFGQAQAEYRQALIFNPRNSNAQKLLSALDGAKKDFERDRHINNGVDLQGRKLYDAAIQEYTLALGMDPRNPDILANIGSAYQQKEDYKAALDFYNKALAILPSHPGATQGLKAAKDLYQQKLLDDTANAASTAFKLGNFQAALGQYQQILASNTSDPAAHFNVAATLQQLKRLDDAIAEYKQAVNLAKGKDKDNYQAALQKAIQDKADPIIEQAVKKHGEKDYASAISLYQQALNLVPDNLKVLFNLAGAYYSRQQFPEAQKIYEQLLQKDPKGQIDDLWFIGTILENAGRGNDALSAYSRYVTEAKAGPYIAQAKARIEALRKDPTDCQKIKSDIELAQDKSADDAYKEAIRLQQAKDWEGSIQQYQKAMAVRPKEYAYPFGLGTLFQQKGDVEMALKWYQTALDLAQASPKIDKKTIDEFKSAVKVAMELKAKPLVEQAVEKQTAGDNLSAITLYKQALDLVPNNARIWTNLGQSYQMTDDFANARTAYQKAVGLNAKDESNDWYLIGAIDENFGQGAQAMDHYRQYLLANPAGSFAKLANERLTVLSKNPTNVQKLPTQGEIKSSKQAQDEFDQGLKLQQSGDAKAAIAHYLKASQLRQSEPAYVYALATAYQASGDLDTAITTYNQAIALDPKNTTYKKSLDDCKDLKAAPIVDEALKKYQAGDLAGAAQLYGQVLQIVPNNARMHTSRAAALQAADDFSGAREEYQKGYDLDPKGERENLYFIAALAENFGQGAQALAVYNKYQTECPAGQYISYAKARTSALSKDVTKTVKLQTSGEQKAAQQVQELFDNSLKAQQSGNYQQAIDGYKQLTNMMPREASYWYALGTAYQAAQQVDDAIAAYQKASQLDPNNKDYKKVAANALDIKAAPIVDDAVKKQNSGDLTGAIEGYKKAILLVPDNARLHTNLASALQSADQFAPAREEFQKAINMDRKGEVENWYYLGVLDENFGRGAQALQDYRTYLTESPRGTNVQLAQLRAKELQLNPNKTQKLVTQAEQQQAAQLSQAYQDAVKLQQEGKMDEAEAKYKEALKLAPNEPTIWYGMGTLYQNRNNVDEAIKSYEKASELNPKEPTYKQYLQVMRQTKAAPMLESAFKKQTTADDKGAYDLAGAIADYEAALRISDDATTHLNLGTAYQGNNNLPKALENYKKALLMDPNQVDAYYYSGTVYEAMKQPGLAGGEYKKYLAKAPTGQNAAACKERLKILGIK